MSKKPVDRAAKAFSDYIATKKIVIADTNAASRTGLAKILIGMGAKTSLVTMAPNMELAEKAVEQMSPHVVIADYNLGKRCGLDLLQQQRKQRPEETKSCLFILVTGNTSQSAVAQAAEEDVDTFILKPYTIETIRQAILRATISKINPSEYMRTIDEGKKLLFDQKLAESMQVFEKAMTLDPKPALACFYHGQAQAMQKAMDNAQGDYHQGLEFNKIHYKCMVGLYEILMEKKLYKDAYELVKRISRYFPANPQRLNSVLRLAVMTSSYEDIERYYQIFTSLDERNEEMIKYICAALVVCGKFYLQRNLGSRAIELFQKAAATASGRTRILKEIVLALVQHDMIKESQEFLRKFPAESRGSIDYLATEIMVNDKLLSPAMIVEMGRKILSKQLYDPLVYKVLIKRSIETGLKDYSENLIAEGTKRWPEMQSEFKQLLEGKSTDPKKAA